MSGVALYELAEARGILDRMLEEQEGEWTPEIEAAYAAQNVAEDVKIERTALFIRERKAYIDAVKTEQERLAAIVKRNQSAVENLTAYMQRCMEQMGKVSVKGKLCSVALQKNSVPTISCSLDVRDLPSPFRKETLTYALNREAVLKLWEDAQPLPPGVGVTYGTHVRIR